MLLAAGGAQAQFIDTFSNTGSSSSSGGCGPGSGSSESIGFPNSFPPTNDPTGIIGSTLDENGYRDVEDVRNGTAESQFSLAFGTIGGANNNLILDADPGCFFQVTLIYDGIGRPGTGLDGQNLRIPGQCPPSEGLTDRFVLDIDGVDPDLQATISVTDTSNSTATLTRTGLQTGSEAFIFSEFANSANTDFSSVENIVVEFSGEDVVLTLDSIAVACDPNDLDGDGIGDEEDVCPDSSLSRTVVVDTCDSDVANTLFPSGCTISDLVANCTGQSSCITGLTGQLESLDILTDLQRDAINGCLPPGPSPSPSPTPPPAVACAGLAATIVGTPGNDVIPGTNGNDIISGLGGNDTINGLDGNDTICGDDGNDTITGGNGRDTLSGMDGRDTISGGNNNDQIFGGTGNDRLNGENGSDRLVGSSGDDTLNGGDNTDTCDGGAGNDNAANCESLSNIP